MAMSITMQRSIPKFAAVCNNVIVVAHIALPGRKLFPVTMKRNIEKPQPNEA